MQQRSITVVGAGITGLWQALTLARRGHRVRLIEQSAEPFARAASRYAGAMLGPYCETEAAAPVIRDLGLRSIDAVARDLSRHRARRHAGGGRRPRQGRDRPLRAPDRGPRDARRRAASASSSPISPAASPPACSIAAKATCRRWRRCASCSSEIERAGVEVAFGTAWTGERVRRRDRSSTAAASAPPASCPTCAACAASASWCAAPR